MDWFAKNAAAIQAIASIVGVLITGVLAYITYQYVQITRNIAESSNKQVTHAKELAEQARKERKEQEKNCAELLRVVASRSRVALEAIPFTFVGMRVFNQPTEADVLDIDSLSRKLGNSSIFSSVNIAVISLRHILAYVQRIKNMPKETGWNPTQDDTEYWSNAVQAAVKSLKNIEDECKKY